MKNSYKEYSLLTPDEIKGLWENSIFIFDTNILLNLYRYSEETSLKFIETIESLNKVWIPYQVGLEFYRNRLTVISDQKKSYEDFEKEINKIINTVEDKNRNPFFSKDLLSKFTVIKDKIKDEVELKKLHFEKALKEDSLLERINKLFENKVGSQPSTDELKAIYNEGEKRYKENTPPGYRDNVKSGNEKFGDLIIWKQIINKAKTDASDVIFICDDRKDDWWLEHRGKTISPRPELLKEFNIECNKKCHFYKPFQFLEFSNKYLHSKVETEIIEEVKNYKPRTFHFEQYNAIDVVLKGEEKNIILFIEELKLTGYDILRENTENNLHFISIFLPKIVDLERRLNEKYLHSLSKYNIELIKITKR